MRGFSVPQDQSAAVVTAAIDEHHPKSGGREIGEQSLPWPDRLPAKGDRPTETRRQVAAEVVPKLATRR